MMKSLQSYTLNTLLILTLVLPLGAFAQDKFPDGSIIPNGFTTPHLPILLPWANSIDLPIMV